MIKLYTSTLILMLNESTLLMVSKHGAKSPTNLGKLGTVYDRNRVTEYREILSAITVY